MPHYLKHMHPVEGTGPSGPEDAARVARWCRVKALFLEALDLPESERRDFVVSACVQEPSIGEEVLSLLASERAAGGFGETPAAELLEADAERDPDGEPRLDPGTRLGAYEVITFISAGGMGEVYRARHTLLGREVALKTLKTSTADPRARRRLMREAQHAASLHHPGICAIHEVVEDDERPFIVMEFVEGRSLSEIVYTDLPPFELAIDWGIQVADALGHAHAAGIIHRDLKSSNVMIDGAGRARVLDFGLSKRMITGGQTDSTLTMRGAVAGTLSHMAPEVLLGRAVDARSDVWSLGVLLYELTTGALPFRGHTPFETSAAILNETHQPARRAPLAARLVIDRCLAKEPAARYQQVAQVRDALDAIRRRRAWPLVGRLLVSARRRTLVTAAGAATLLVILLLEGPALVARAGMDSQVSSLALLPLENATGDDGAEFWAQGLTEALTEQLGSVADVRVISRGSAARAAAMTDDDREAARQLGADVIVSGRLRRASDRVAVDLRALDAATGRTLWSDTYERSANQVLALQADVVRALAAEVRLGLRPGAWSSLTAARSVNPEAYEAYLKGRFEWSRRTPRSLAAAVTHFTRALELDPTWAPAHAALADCYNQFGTQLVGTGSPAEFRPRAAAAAIRALQIDASSAEAHATLGYIRHYEWQWDDAERELQRAIELNPSYALARIWYANLLATRGRVDEALQQVSAARELDPFSLVVNTNVGWVLSMAGRYDEAIAQLSRTIEIDSTYVQAHLRLADALTNAGLLDEARGEVRRVLTMAGRTASALSAMAALSVIAGDTAAASEILAELVDRSRTEYVPPGTLVDIHARLGDIDGALAWAKRAFEERANYVVYIGTDTALAALQRDPRFKDLVASSGLNQGRWN